MKKALAGCNFVTDDDIIAAIEGFCAVVFFFTLFAFISNRIYVELFSVVEFYLHVCGLCFCCCLFCFHHVCKVIFNL